MYAWVEIQYLDTYGVVDKDSAVMVTFFLIVKCRNLTGGAFGASLSRGCNSYGISAWVALFW